VRFGASLSCLFLTNRDDDDDDDDGCIFSKDIVGIKMKRKHFNDGN